MSFVKKQGIKYLGGLVRGMRNWIAHAYSDMDEEVIWETALNDIPGLLLFCDRLLEESVKQESHHFACDYI